MSEHDAPSELTKEGRMSPQSQTPSMAVRPCIHPRCRDSEGNPRLTTQTMCDPCRNHYRRQLGWLRDDYLFVKAFMPRPIASDTGRGGRKVTYGHPNEWATDTARTIAKVLNKYEDDLREELGDPPPANIHTAPEAHIVAEAHRYLAARFPQLCTFTAAEGAAEDIHSLHGTIRAALGYNKQVQHLTGVRCPTCDYAALVRSVGQIDCENCGRIITETLYPLLTRIVLEESLDTLIEAYDSKT